MRNIGEDWKEIGDDGKEDKQGEEEPWKQFRRKKKKLSKKSQKLENGQRKMKMKWAIQQTLTMSCKSLGQETLRESGIMTWQNS